MKLSMLLESNALSVKELNQKVVDETLNKLATKDFVRAEIEKLRAEMKKLEQKFALLNKK